MESSSSVTEPSQTRASSCAFGLFFLGFTYLGLVLSLRFLYAEDCSEETCQNEGVDDTYRAWGSDYFVAAVSLLLALHLRCFQRSTRRSGTLAQLFLAGAFALTGFRARFYPNSGQTDNVGMMEYWAIGAIATFFLTLSATAQAFFAIETAAVTPRSKHPFCAFFLIHLWLAAIILTAIVNIVGSVWCSMSKQLQTDELVDNFQDNLYWNERHICLQLVGLSENLIWFPYALLWIPVGLLLRAAAFQRPAVVLGLSNTRAALGAIGFQWITGSMYVVTVSFASWLRYEMELSDDETFLELWNRVYGVEVFHLGVLLSAYCAHNLAWTLTIPTSTAMSISSTTIKPQSSAAAPGNGDIQKEDSSESKRVRFSEEVVSTTEVDLEADSAERVDIVNNDAENHHAESSTTSAEITGSTTDAEVTDAKKDSEIADAKKDSEITDATKGPQATEPVPVVSAGGNGWSRFLFGLTN